MSNHNRHDNQGKQGKRVNGKNTNYDKRNSNGQFAKRDDGGSDRKCEEYNNCYKHHDAAKTLGRDWQRKEENRDVKVGFGSILLSVSDTIRLFDSILDDYLVASIVSGYRTRQEKKSAFLKGAVIGLLIGIVVATAIAVFHPAIVNYAKSICA